MKNLSYGLVPVLLFVGLVVDPAPAIGQCMVGPPVVMTYPTYNIVRKALQTAGGVAASYLCHRVGGTMFRGCYPTAGQTTTAYATLTASAYTTATNPSCAWECQCATQTPTFTTGPSDGLPVELMNYSIESHTDAEGDGHRHERLDADTGR